MRSRLFLKLDGTRARFFLPVSPSLMPGGVASDAGDLGLRPGPCGLCIFFFWSAPRRVLLVFDMLRGLGVPVSLGCTPSKPPPLRPENLMPHAPADVRSCVQPWGRDGVERRPPPARGPRPPRPAPRVWLGLRVAPPLFQLQVPIAPFVSRLGLCHEVRLFFPFFFFISSSLFNRRSCREHRIGNAVAAV